MRQIFGILLIIIFLGGCTVSGNQKTNEFTMPKDYETYSYEVDIIDGYKAEVYIIEDDEEYVSNFDLWLQAKEKNEQADKYRMIRHLYDSENEDNFAEREEERIEDYCKDYGYERCMDIDRTCEEDGCHKVSVVCDDDNYDEGIDRYDECRKFDVQVEHDFDDELTEEDEDQVICD